MKQKILNVILVLGSIAFLLMILAPDMFESHNHDRAKTLATKSIMLNLKEPMKEYALRDPFGRFPEASLDQEGNGTAILVMKLRTMNLFQFEESNLTEDTPQQIIDGWGNPMRYHPWKEKEITKAAHNKKSYDLWSAGPDEEFGTEDDVTNWAKILETDSE